MSGELDATHDPAVRSWVDSANVGDTDFPLQNLPFAVFRRGGSAEEFRGGVGIGDQIVDLGAIVESGLLSGAAGQAAAAGVAPTLNALMALGPHAWNALRFAMFEGLRESAGPCSEFRDSLVPQAVAEYTVPANIGNYTDFYASIHHAMAVGRLFRPDQPLTPNYRWMPIAYHGRASSVGVSGMTFHRPVGQSLPAGAEHPLMAPSGRLDYELEVGIFIGPGNARGMPIPVNEAEGHIFGLCLLNDWSARDLQAWECQPLGPFLGKNFATTISPWIVSMAALAPFRLPFSRSAGEPQPLPYLDCPAVRAGGAIDITLEAYVQTAAMSGAGLAAQRLSRSNFRHSYWTIAQMVAHHTVSGCNLQPGDLFGSGTQSGPDPSEAGSLLELSAGGRRALQFPLGETRCFLADGDRVILRAWCERAGSVRIGFGAATGQVLPAY